MIVYVNGDSHSAGAEAKHYACFAEDDSRYAALGRKPHPENLAVSYGQLLANELNASLLCEAESASSNDRILRTTWNYLQNNHPDLLIIGWSTWEREEWLHNNVWYQLSASGYDSVPPELKDKYKQWVIEQNYITRERKMLQWHEKIYYFHKDLQDLKIPHLFFNTYTDFESIRTKQITTDTIAEAPPEYNWDGCYIEPYNQNYTYYYWLKNQGFKTAKHDSYHYGADSHKRWAEFLYQNYVQKLLTQ